MPVVIDAEVSPEAKAAYEQGVQLQGSGQAAAALEQFDRALALDSKFADAHLARAQVLADLGQQRSAVKSLTTGLTSAENNQARAAIHFQRGELYLDSQKFQKAVDDFQRAFELQPSSADIAHRLGKAQRSLALEELAAGIPDANARIQQALVAFDRAIASQPDFAAALSDRASLHADLGDIEKAKQDLTQALSLDSDNRELRYRLAVLNLQQATADANRDMTSSPDTSKQLQSAVDLLTAALDSPVEPPAEEEIDDEQLRLARAVALVELAGNSPDESIRQSHIQAALEDCTRVTEAKPDLAAAHFQRGVALRLLHRYRDAIPAFSEALRLSPENTEAHIRRGIAWYHLDEFDLALSDFNAVGVLPGDARPWFWTGVIHARRGDHLEAIRAYSEAIDENPRYRLAYSNRALSLMHMGHWQRAIEDCNAMIQLNPNDAQAYHRRGLAQQRLGRTAEARRSFLKADQNSGS